MRSSREGRRGGGSGPDSGKVGCVKAGVEVGVGVGVGAAFSAASMPPPRSVLPSGENVCRRSLARSMPAPYVAMTPRRPSASVTSQTKPLDESMPVATAATYVWRSYREPIWAAITLPSVCVRYVFTHLSVSDGS
jgi:hypothetical protein